MIASSIGPISERTVSTGSTLRNSPLAMPRAISAFEDRDAAADHLLQIEAPDLGKGAQFGDHHLGDRGHRRLLDAARHEIEDARDQRSDRPAVRLDQAATVHEIDCDRLAHDALEQRRLVLEVEVDRRLD